MANCNRQKRNRDLRFKRRRKEVRRFIQRCEAANLAAKAKGEPPTDFTGSIQAFKSTRT